MEEILIRFCHDTIQERARILYQSRLYDEQGLFQTVPEAEGEESRRPRPHNGFSRDHAEGGLLYQHRGGVSDC